MSADGAEEWLDPEARTFLRQCLTWGPMTDFRTTRGNACNVVFGSMLACYWALGPTHARPISDVFRLSSFATTAWWQCPDRRWVVGGVGGWGGDCAHSD